MNTEVKCSIIEVASNEPLYQIEVHNSLIPAYIVKKHDGLIPYIHIEYFRCPVWSFLCSVTVSCPFPSRFFGQSLPCATGEHCWTMLTSEVM